VARRPFALDRLGTGARQDGGRWNHPGFGVIYAGATPAIAAVEKLVHINGVDPGDLVLARIDLPRRASIERHGYDDLPSGWDAVPAGRVSMDFGTKWIEERRSLMFCVPSTIVREEMNAILNPSHPQFGGVTMKIVRDFVYDLRLLR